MTAPINKRPVATRQVAPQFAESGRCEAERIGRQIEKLVEEIHAVEGGDLPAGCVVCEDWSDHVLDQLRALLDVRRLELEWVKPLSLAGVHAQLGQAARLTQLRGSEANPGIENRIERLLTVAMAGLQELAHLPDYSMGGADRGCHPDDFVDVLLRQTDQDARLLDERC